MTQDAGGARGPARIERPSPTASSAASTKAGALGSFVGDYCAECHDEIEKKAELALEAAAAEGVPRHPDVWEKVVRKLRARQMPPVGETRPDDATYDAVVASLETSLDRAAAAQPNPGRTATIRRLTRTEYQNAIRDLLALDVDVDVAAARRRVELRLRQRDGRRSLADAARSLHLGGGEDQPPRGRAARAARPAARRSGFRRTSRRKSTSRACRSARAAARVVALHVPAGRRVRDPDPPDARSRRARRRAERSRTSSSCCWIAARVQVFTVKPPQRGARTHATRARSSTCKIRVPVEGRPARGRRRVSEEAVGAARDRAPAVPGALQLLPASARSSRRSTRSRSSVRTTRHGPRRHAEPAAALRRAGRRPRRSEDARRHARSCRR